MAAQRVTFLDLESKEACNGEGIWPTPNKVSDTPSRPYGALPTAMGAKGIHHSPGVLLKPYRRNGSPYPTACQDDSESALGGKLGRISSSVSVLFCMRQSNKRCSTDAGDESLQRYKESLGLGGGKDLSDPNDPRVCIIQSLTLESPGRAPVVIDLTTEGSLEKLKKTPFKIKEGVTFTMSATFKVQHEILSGLHYVQAIKRGKIPIPGGKTDEMIGSYAPNTDKTPTYTKKFQEETAPSGWAVRGTYHVRSSFVDDDKKTHLQFEWAFEIDKDW